MVISSVVFNEPRPSTLYHEAENRNGSLTSLKPQVSSRLCLSHKLILYSHHIMLTITIILAMV